MTEEVWPGQRVSRASYVVSMLRPQVVKDLELKRFGYEPVPLDPPFATFAADGTPMLFHNDDAAARASIAQVSPHDAAAMAGFDAMMERVADVLRPMMLRPPRRSAPSTRATCSSCCARRAARPGSHARA